MSTPSLRTLIIMLFLGLVGPSQGCGDSTESAASRPKRKKRKKKRNRVTKGQVKESLAGIPKKLQNVDWTTNDDLAGTIRESRDPFLPFVDDLKVKAEEEEKKQVTRIKTAVGEADVDELNLIAIITGTAVHKAMVEDGRGVGHIVRAGDVIGGSPPYRIVRITRNEVIFRALEQTEDKQVPAEIRKVLLSKEELQEYGR